MKLLHKQKNINGKKIIKYSLLICYFILNSLAQGQSYIQADPLRLKFIEYNQFFSPSKHIQATFIRPFFKTNSTFDINLTNEYYFNSGLPNQENMDVRYIGKGSGRYLSYRFSYAGKFIAFVFEPYMLSGQNLNSDEVKSYLSKIKNKELYAYGVYQIEANGRSLFSKIEGDENTIMGLPVKQIKEYLNNSV